MTAPWVVPVPPDSLTVPRYRDASFGRWRIRHHWHLANVGFWGVDAGPKEVTFLEGPSADGNGPANWMSTVQLELESQEVGIHGAVGTTVILGFGLGWAVVNAALNPAVDRVIAVERDPDVIGLSDVSGVFDGLSPDTRAKIEIRQADAFEFEPDGPVDTLIADIWPDWQAHRVYEDMLILQSQIGADRVHFWGQEMTIWRRAIKRFGPDVPFDWTAIRRTVSEELELPLILPDWPDYPERILRLLQRCSGEELSDAYGPEASLTLPGS